MNSTIWDQLFELFMPTLLLLRYEYEYFCDSLDNFCHVNFFRNFSTDNPPVYLSWNVNIKLKLNFKYIFVSPRHPSCWKNMIWAGTLVAVCHSRSFSDEKWPIVTEMLVIPVQILVTSLNLKMFRGITITNPDRLFFCLNDYNLSVVGPRLGGGGSANTGHVGVKLCHKLGN